MNANDMRRAKFYQDLYELPEDDRIKLIGHWVTDHAETVTFLTDDIPGKADRYVAKLAKWFPEIEVLDRGSGPVANVVYVKVRLKQSAGQA